MRNKFNLDDQVFCFLQGFANEGGCIAKCRITGMLVVGQAITYSLITSDKIEENRIPEEDIFLSIAELEERLLAKEELVLQQRLKKFKENLEKMVMKSGHFSIKA